MRTEKNSSKVQLTTACECLCMVGVAIYFKSLNLESLTIKNLPSLSVKKSFSKFIYLMCKCYFELIYLYTGCFATRPTNVEG